MKIVADEYIPLVENYFGSYGEIIKKPGRAITQTDLIDADIFLTRSVTTVNEKLLKNTAVKFVGNTTSGMDHLDIPWLDANHIQWSSARGSNAITVVEYVICVIAALEKRNLLLNKKVRAAVIGVGLIGQQVVEKLKLLGFDVVLCDPLRTDIVSTPIEELQDLDFISLHTPLTKAGAYPTYHLIEKDFLARQKENCILLNAGRGEVIASEDLKKHGKKLHWCLDVFENEPGIDSEILKNSFIATPHIAGHSIQSKYRAVEMVYQAAIQKGVIVEKNIERPTYPKKEISVSDAKDWRDVVLKVFDPFLMKEEMKNNNFDVVRKKYGDRDEFGFIELRDVKLPKKDQELLKLLGFFSSSLRIPRSEA